MKKTLHLNGKARPVATQLHTAEEILTAIEALSPKEKRLVLSTIRDRFKSEPVDERTERERTKRVVRAMMRYAYMLRQMQLRFGRFMKEKDRDAMYTALAQSFADNPDWTWRRRFNRLKKLHPREMEGMGGPDTLKAGYHEWRNRPRDDDYSPDE